MCSSSIIVVNLGWLQFKVFYRLLYKIRYCIGSDNNFIDNY